MKLDDYKNNDENYWNVKSKMDSENIDSEAFDIWLSLTGETPTVESIDSFEEDYMGKFSSGAEYAEYVANDYSDFSKSWLYKFIDWNAVWSDMSHDYFEEKGHIFFLH